LKICPKFYLLLSTLLPVINKRLQFTPEKWVSEIFFIQNYPGRGWGGRGIRPISGTYLFGSLGLGALIHWCFERPMLILRDRLR